MQNLIEKLETQLILVNIDIDTVDKIIESIRHKVSQNTLQTFDELSKLIYLKLEEIITPCEQPLIINRNTTHYVI